MPATGRGPRRSNAPSHRCTHARLPQSGILTIAPPPSRTVSVQRTLKDWPNAVAPEARAHAGVVGGSICKLHLRALLGCVRRRHPPSRPPRRASPIRQTPRLASSADSQFLVWASNPGGRRLAVPIFVLLAQHKVEVREEQLAVPRLLPRFILCVDGRPLHPVAEPCARALSCSCLGRSRALRSAAARP